LIDKARYQPPQAMLAVEHGKFKEPRGVRGKIIARLWPLAVTYRPRRTRRNKMTPREFFRYMPDEVFEMWLAPFIQQIGWPFTEITDDLSGTRWSTLLRDIPLDVWNQLIWSRVDVEFSKIDFAAFNRLAFEDIIGHCVHGRSTAAANLPNTKERFRTCAEFIRVHQTIPKPIAVMSRNNKIEVIDGIHRIAALLHVGLPKGYRLPIWIVHPQIALT
jgi:hypothetical protein